MQQYLTILVLVQTVELQVQLLFVLLHVMYELRQAHISALVHVRSLQEFLKHKSNVTPTFRNVVACILQASLSYMTLRPQSSETKNLFAGKRMYCCSFKLKIKKINK